MCVTPHRRRNTADAVGATAFTDATVVAWGIYRPRRSYRRRNEPLLSTDGGIGRMATDTAERRIAHVRGVTVTAIACLAGIGAAIVSAFVAEGATDLIGVYVLAGAIIVQFPLFRVLEKLGLQLDTDDFGAKDYLYVAFMTFALWFVAWTILLTTGY